MSKNDVIKPSEAEAEEAVRTLLRWIGEDPERKGLVRTPHRVLKSFGDWYAGYNDDPAEILGSSFPDADGFKDMVALIDIDFESHCEHHMAPFIGKAHVAYMPSDRVVGVSKIVRVITAYSKRLQVQEKLTKQIAEAIQNELQPLGVAVVLQAKHQCMTTRGVYKKGISMATNTMLGCFEDDNRLRNEFLKMIGQESV